MKEFLKKVLNLILDMLFDKPTKTSDPLSSSSGELLVTATKKISEAGLLLRPLLNGMSKEEREYTAKVAFFRSLNTQDLTIDEVVEFGEHLNEAVRLGITVQEKHMEFWNQFRDVVNSIKNEFVDISARAAAVALRTVIRI